MPMPCGGSNSCECKTPYTVHPAAVAAVAITLFALLIIGVLGRMKVIPMGTAAGCGISIPAALLIVGGSLGFHSDIEFFKCSGC